MTIFLVVKGVGKTRGFEKIGIEIEDKEILSVSSFIRFLVHREIECYESEAFKVLSQEDINRMVDNGKVAFGFKYREHEPINRTEAVNNAIDAFRDELFAMFINDRQIQNLDDRIALKDGDEVSLVRLTMLSGRYF